MASIQEIQDKLNIVVGDREINPGMCQDMKNRYYNINNDYLVVEFLNDKHMVFSNDAKTRELLSNRVWCINSGYAHNRGVGCFHQNYLNYEEGLVCDHKNMLKYDNRQTNLRIVTQQQNMRNKTKSKNNTSGENGVSFNNSEQAWVTQIHNNNNVQIKKRFSIRQHGQEEAKRLAIEQRHAWEIEFGYEGQ